MNKILSVRAIASVVAAREKPFETSTTNVTGAAVVSAGNTRINDRDKKASRSPLDQRNGQADLDTTQSIRKEVMADDSLPTNAKC